MVNFQAFKDLIWGTTLFNNEYLFAVILTAVTIIAITRNTHGIQIGTFFVTIIYGIIGLQVHLIQYVIASIFFVLGSISPAVIGSYRS